MFTSTHLHKEFTLGKRKMIPDGKSKMQEVMMNKKVENMLKKSLNKYIVTI